MFEFQIINRYKNARTGVFHTPHGDLQTPELAIVATDGEIRAIPKEAMDQLPTKFTITNTFHTFTKDLVRGIEKAKGINNYLNFKGVTATDSGGFQVFSLGFGKAHGVGKIASIFPEENIKEKGLLVTRDRDNLLDITDDGVMFNYNKKLFLFTPELSMDIQKRLGGDIMFAFDECTSPLNSHEYTKNAMEKTHYWLKRCLACHSERNLAKQKVVKKSLDTPLYERDRSTSKLMAQDNKLQALFGIVQGGAFEDLRKISAQYLVKQPVSGYGIGGSLGRSKENIWQILEWTLPILPKEKPRHLLGIGQVRDIFESVERGVDLFDCVIPTREARHKTLYTTHGKINVRKMRTVNEVADKNCPCQMCREKITIYQLYELYKLKDPRAFFYATIHNIQFYSDLMEQIRAAINKNRFSELKENYFNFY